MAHIIKTEHTDYKTKVGLTEETLTKIAKDKLKELNLW